MGLMLATARAALTFAPPAANPYCPANADMALAISEQTTTDYTTFEQVATYINSDGESAPLLLQKTLPADNFKFFTYNDDLSIDTAKSRACGSTATHTKVGLFGPMLITSLSSLLYACKYNPTPTGDITITKLSLVGTSQPKPYYVDGNTIHAHYFDGAKNKFCYYQLSGNANTDCAVRTGQMYGTLSEISGNSEYFYDFTDEHFWKRVANVWVDDTVSYPIVTGRTVKIFNLQSFLVIDLLDTATLKKTQLYKVQVVAASTITSAITTSATAIRYFTDGFNNLMQINSEQLVWVSVSSQNTLYHTKIPKASLGDTSLILNVGLSKAKAVLLYAAKVEYWRHKQADNVQKYFSKSFAAADISQPATGTKQFKLALSCMCKGIDTMACFSATLNCVILRKAGSSCIASTFAAIY